MSYCFCLSDIYVVKFSINNTQNRINRENFMQIPNWMLTNSVILRSSTSFIIHIAVTVIIVVILFVYFVMSLKKATRYDEVHVSAVLKLKNNMARICISGVFFWMKEEIQSLFLQLMSHPNYTTTTTTKMSRYIMWHSGRKLFYLIKK